MRFAVTLLILTMAIFVSAETTYLNKVQAAPGLILKRTNGPVGLHVFFTMSGFSASDTTCSVGSTTNSAAVTGGACILSSGSGNGTFIVGNVPPGDYVIRVTGSTGDFAEQVFTVSSGPKIQLRPPQGPTGTHVTVNGTGFLPTDTTCTITSPSSSSILVNPACAIVLPQNVSTRPTNVTGSFYVGNVPIGQYVIRVTGNPGGDFAEAVFNVTRGPQLILKPSKGPTGTSVGISGGGFLTSDTTCSITGPTSSSILQGAACSVTPGSGLGSGLGNNVTGSFIVGNVLPGQYVIRVTGNPGGDFAEAIFNVTLGPLIKLSPATGPPGTHVAVNGTGFSPVDASCSVSSPGSGAVLGGSQACVIRAGTGIVNASFTIGNVLPGQYIIQITGSQGDFAQALLNVISGPLIKLSPGSGLPGAHVSVNGTGFLPTDTTCVILSGASNAFNPILPGSQACVIRVGTGIVNGSFNIAGVPPGQYVIQVTGNYGDFAQAILNVLAIAPTLILYPANATNGATVSFRGTGFSVTDTGCIVQASPSNLLITSPTCSIVNPGVAQGAFVVGPFATTNVKWNVTVRGTPVNDIPSPPMGAIFNVTASVVVTPPSGTINTVFTYTGSGFSSTATSCGATIVPPFPSGSSHPSCYLSIQFGQVSGTVIAPTNTVPGTYGINVGDNKGHNATGFFTLGTPSALITLTPATVGQGQPVGVAGIGFNPNDTYCTVTAGTFGGVSLFALPPNCAISGGYVSGTFTVATGAVGGYYLITVTGYINKNATRADFASNFLGVNLASTITTFTPTTTTLTTTTSVSTTTTSVATSYSYSSTTFSTTGILFTTYTYLTVTTVSGLTFTTLTHTFSTTQTVTTVTVTTTTSFTTAACSALPCPYAVSSQGLNSGPFADEFGLLAVLLLVVPMLLRRLFS